MLYIVVTPIGNLSDMTYRAVEVLGSVDLVLCEDTRHSAVLLSHYGITTPTRSYEKFSESRKADEIADMLAAGKNVALVSDAGTPVISDPAMCSSESSRNAACRIPSWAADAPR